MSKEQMIKDKVAECIRKANATFSITLPPIIIKFDLRGQAAGQAVRKNGVHYVRFNVSHMRAGGKTWEHLLNDTVPHEVAHSCCQAFPKLGSGHDAGWRRVCIALGGNGQARYSEDDAPEAVSMNNPYIYITTQGHEVRISKVRHGKIQRGTQYIVSNLGKLNNACEFRVV